MSARRRGERDARGREDDDGGADARVESQRRGVGKLKHWSTTNEAERNDRAATKVFCNRSLNMKRIGALRFDMDYIDMYKPRRLR